MKTWASVSIKPQREACVEFSDDANTCVELSLADNLHDLSKLSGEGVAELST